MIKSATLQIAGEFNKEFTSDFDAEDTINLYCVYDATGKSKVALRATPGLSLAAIVNPDDTNDNPIRCSFVNKKKDHAYIVAGNKVYRIDSNLNIADSIGTLTTDSGLVYAATNNAQQVMFVDGQAGYIYNENTGIWAPITAEIFPAAPTRVCFLDAYFIVTGGETDRFFISAPNDGTKWDILYSYAEAFATPGDLIGCEVVKERLFLFKTDAIEVWWNAGAADFPLRRDNNLLLPYGVAALGSITADYGLLFWLSADKSGAGSIMVSDGQQATPVSTPAVENLIRSLTNPSDATAFVYKGGDGNVFYQINFTTDDITLLYNHSANKGYQWSRLERLATAENGYKQRHIADCHMYFYNKHYVGSYLDSTLYELSLDFTDDYYTPIRRERILPNFSDENFVRIRMDKLILDMQMGLGDLSDRYKKPKIYLSLSRDGGFTFGNEMSAPLGRLGHRKGRCIWRKLGVTDSLNGVVFKFIIYAPVKPIVIFDGQLVYEGLRT